MAQHEFSTDLNQSKSGIDTLENHRDALGIPYPIIGNIQWYKNGMILAAGGGGPSKTGIANGFEILQWIKNNPTSNTFKLSRHSWYNTHSDIVYCIRQNPAYPYQFIAGIGNNLVILEITSYAQPQSNNAFDYDWNIAKKHKNKNSIQNPPIRTVHIISNVESAVMPYEEDPHTVSKVDISGNGKYISIGGTDGIVRLYKYDFINPKQSLELISEINVSEKHFAFLNRNKSETEPPTEIERLLFDENNEYLSIINHKHCCYVWNVRKDKMETVLMDSKAPLSYIFRDCVFMNDRNGNKYCICAVNAVRTKKRARVYSYLYQYLICDDSGGQWYKRHFCTIAKTNVIRMIGDPKTRNIITLHFDGQICVFDGMNLTKLYSFANDGRFFLDIAISPNLYWNKKRREYNEYLLIALMNDVLIKPVTLKPCYMKDSGGGVSLCCCSFKAIAILLGIAIVIVAVIIPLMGGQDSSYQFN